MEVFEFLSKGEGMPLSQLARQLKQSPETVYRILFTLEKPGLLSLTMWRSFGTSVDVTLSSAQVLSGVQSL